LANEVRARQKATVIAALDSDRALASGLLGDFREGVLRSVCWIQQQPGRAAHLWPPVPASLQELGDLDALVSMAVGVARSQGAVLVQSLLETDAGDEARVLKQAGFKHIADLLYLVSVAERFPSAPPSIGMSLQLLSDADPRRLARLIGQTYVGSLDCPVLDGARSIDDVLAGYRAVGTFRPELWFIARANDRDVGCLLLADHSPEPVWEIVYMGVAPEARGQGIGFALTRHAQGLAAREEVERLVLAVDAANEPAIEIYASAGFVTWDHRSVFVEVIDALLKKN
jgi:ribosomal protein S18 acetylase RimI-like enzyme